VYPFSFNDDYILSFKPQIKRVTMRRLYRLFYFLCLLSGLKQEIHAQSFCATDEVHRYLLRTNPEYKKAIELQNVKWQQYSKQTMAKSNRLALAQGDLLEIPVVIHVIHTGGDVGTINNPSDDDLIAWIADLNAIFAANYNSGPGGINTDGSVSIPVHFKLARRTPDCQATNGINRVDGSILPEFSEWGVYYAYTGGEKHGPSDSEVKALSRWPSESYMNIWLVARINGAGGYASLPGTSSPEVDGIVVVNTEVTILAHEVGHFLLLYHTFQGSQDGICPPNNDCTIDGDQVCDTEPHSSQGCNDSIRTGNSGITP
jgi:hypothetical protein